MIRKGVGSLTGVGSRGREPDPAAGSGANLSFAKTRRSTCCDFAYVDLASTDHWDRLQRVRGSGARFDIFRTQPLCLWRIRPVRTDRGSRPLVLR
jgi:hypothetical protein